MPLTPLLFPPPATPPRILGRSFVAMCVYIDA
jgi:hypothetical protein